MLVGNACWNTLVGDACWQGLLVTLVENAYGRCLLQGLVRDTGPETLCSETFVDAFVPRRLSETPII